MNIKPQQMEMFVASRLADSLGGSERLLELILERRNMLRAMNQVIANQGAPGVDGMTTNQLKGYLKRLWPQIKQDLLNGVYRPLPVRRKEIDKPDGGVRLLGIPTVMDRLIQQAIAQVLEQIWDPTFSEYSYADDFMIYCKRRKAAERVEKSIAKFITAKLKLKVNEAKSAVSRPWLRKFLGFTFISMCGQTKIRIHRKTIERFKARVRELTNRNSGKSLDQIIKGLNRYLIGWWNYYRLTEARYIFKSLKGWIIRRLRCVVWKQWKNPRTKVRNLEKLGIAHKDAMLCGNARKKHWRMSKVKWVIIALSNRYFFERGLFLPAQQPS